MEAEVEVEVEVEVRVEQTLVCPETEQLVLPEDLAGEWCTVTVEV